MPAMVKWALVVATLLAASCTSPSRDDIAGAWLIAPVEEGERPMLLTFMQEDDAWTGVLRSTGGDRPLQGIRVEDDGAVSFDLGRGAPARSKGVVEDGALRLNMITAFSNMEWVAHRASAKEVAQVSTMIALPEKLPVPPLRDVADNGLARTPPMGWNSWNKFHASIDDQAVRGIADALVDSGLAEVGFVYVNIDDGWQGERDKNGVLHPNSKFPDMKALADYVHGKGLKFGIYTSPGPFTCGGFIGSYGHEEQDARTFAEWGVDYLKYDWCAARRLYETKEEMQALYQKMGEALQATGRPIVYSLCQYGFHNVGEWGRKVGGNLWRTTEDISDKWKKIEEIGFSQNGMEKYAGPGGWNDPDMLEIGNGGASVEEYRTHMTLWSILAAPLLLGHDPRTMTPEIKALLTNKEVIAIDQDSLGEQGRRVAQNGATEVWKKTLADGSVAVALFNRGEAPAEIEARWSEIGLGDVSKVRDLWLAADVEAAAGHRATVPAHGAALFRVYP